VSISQGHARISRQHGLTYAEYARGGFWQLLAVTALALGVLAFDSRWAPVRTPEDRAVKRGLLAAPSTGIAFGR
jgi:hypothetical protein